MEHDVEAIVQKFIDARRPDADLGSRIGNYVYALYRPGDDRPFYIGKGQDGRVLAHFAVESDRSKKAELIRQIFSGGFEPRIEIIRWGIESPEVAFQIECALIDALQPEMNLVAGHGSREFGRRPLDQLLSEFAVLPVAPTEAHDCVFVFSIGNALREGRGVYDATRRAWPPSRHMQRHAIAVGLEAGISRGVYQIDKWSRVVGSNRREFTGRELPDSNLLNKRWNFVTDRIGPWSYGGYGVVEFDGAGRFRVLRGSSDRESWHSLEQR